MEGEVDLDPELPPITSSVTSAPIRKPMFSRKRTRDYDAAIANSSDPAVFSSDDNVGSLDEYTSKRQKNQWKGTWWGDRVKRLSDSHRTKRHFQRNYDSGIFMGSEGTESSFDDDFLDNSRRKQDDGILPILEDGNSSSLSVADHQLSSPTQKLNSLPIGRTRALTLNPVSERVNAIIHQCLEDGNETVDLSSMYLNNETLPNHLLTPLRSLTKYTSIHTPPMSQEAYESLEPHLRVFLSSNLLRSVPSEVFNLSNLHVLSLRQNQLTEIPPAISKLTHLIELNIGGNQLRTLPWEILQMLNTGQLKKFSPFPNPFRRFDQHELLTRSRTKSHKPNRPSTAVARSSSTYFAINGTPIPPGRHSTLHLPHPSTPSSRVPSLLELALRTTSRLPYFTDLLPSLLHHPTDHDDNTNNNDYEPHPPLPPAPETLTTLLTHATQIHNAGGQTCPTCRSTFIVPRAEWVEWWDLSSLSSSPLRPSPGEQQSRFEEGDREEDEEEDEEEGDPGTPIAKKRPFANVVPFRRRVCSWGCI